MKKSVIQDWVNELSLMQQSVLFSAIRGPDGIRKHHPCKPLIRWYRRCILLSAFEGIVIDNPLEPGGGSFTGPIDVHRQYVYWEDSIQYSVDKFMDARDELPYHYTVHFMHAAEIIGYKHPDPRIRAFWFMIYTRMVNCFHLFPETEAQMDNRLGDDETKWKARSDETSVCSD